MNYTYESINNQNGISVSKFSLNIGSKILLTETDLIISRGINYGLIAPNGQGKTSLLNFIAEKLELDGGKIHMVKQENVNSDKNVLEELLSSHIQYNKYLENLNLFNTKLSETQCNDEIIDINDKLKELHTESVSNEYDKLEPKAKKILSGLGFNQNSNEGNLQLKKVNEFSGGWKMRISIAKALLNEPDILIMDEPTNHLDLDAVIWLGNYLKNWNSHKKTNHKTLILVSHDKYFLDDVVEKIIRIHQCKLLTYTGNYERMLRMIRQERKEIEKKWNKEKKNVKSKKEKKNKRPQKEYSVEFSFSDNVSNKGIIKLEDVSFSYDSNKTIFKNIDFCVRAGEKISIVGPNGSGKSTLLKLICGEIEPNNGTRFTDKIKIAKYSQHFEDSLPLELTPVEYLQKVFTNWNLTDVRKHLSTYNLDSKAHNIPMRDCSGGQKSRIVFSTLCEASILILDEPTNHLDMETIDALTSALSVFEGGVVVVSHDAKLISELECDLYLCNSQNILKYLGDFDDYKDKLLSKLDN